MDEKLSLSMAVDMALDAVHNSSDCSDNRTVAMFMMLGDAIVNGSHEILDMDDTSKLALAAGSVIASSFCDRYPKYKDYEMGLVIGATGFYAFKKLIKKGMLPKMYYPAFVVLLHYGRRHLAELVECAMLWKQSGNSPYDPFFRMEYDSMEEKKVPIVIAMELAYINHCKRIGQSDGLDSLEREARFNMTHISQYAGDISTYEDKLYNYIERNLKSSEPFEFNF